MHDDDTEGPGVLSSRWTWGIAAFDVAMVFATAWAVFA